MSVKDGLFPVGIGGNRVDDLITFLNPELKRALDLGLVIIRINESNPRKISANHFDCEFMSVHSDSANGLPAASASLHLNGRPRGTRLTPILHPCRRGIGAGPHHSLKPVNDKKVKAR
jgi:hypothetical protein